jgi:hypothetical protein
MSLVDLRSLFERTALSYETLLLLRECTTRASRSLRQHLSGAWIGRLRTHTIFRREGFQCRVPKIASRVEPQRVSLMLA